MISCFFDSDIRNQQHVLIACRFLIDFASKNHVGDGKWWLVVGCMVSTQNRGITNTMLLVEAQFVTPSLLWRKRCKSPVTVLEEYFYIIIEMQTFAGKKKSSQLVLGFLCKLLSLRLTHEAWWMAKYSWAVLHRFLSALFRLSQPLCRGLPKFTHFSSRLVSKRAWVLWKPLYSPNNYGKSPDNWLITNKDICAFHYYRRYCKRQKSSFFWRSGARSYNESHQSRIDEGRKEACGSERGSDRASLSAPVVYKDLMDLLLSCLISSAVLVLGFVRF